MRRSTTLRVAALLAALLVACAATPVFAASPVIVIPRYRTRPSDLTLGTPFDLRVTISNAGSKRAQGVLVTLGPTAGMAAIGTGNVKYLGSVAAHHSRVVSFRLIADPSSAPGLRPVKVGVRYNGGSTTQEIGLLFTRKASLDVANILSPSKAVVGQPFSVSAEVVNGGSHRLSGLAIRYEGSGVTIKGEPDYVGVLDPGDSEIAKTQAVATAAGAGQVVLVASYRDDFGRSRETTRLIAIQAAPATTGGPTSQAPATEAAQKSGLGDQIVVFFRGLLGLGG
jgi:hypothetical protein